MNKGVGRDMFWNYSNTIGVGYIYLPENYKGQSKRDEFIKDCYRRERVSILIEGGTVKHDCYITQEALRGIVFPENSVSEGGETLGSAVIFIPEPNRDHPVIVGVISKTDESNFFKHKEFKVLRNSGGNYAILTIDGEDGSVGITTFGSGSGKGNLRIDVSNGSSDAKVELKVKGSVNIETTSEVNLKSTGNVNVTSSGDVNVSPEGLINLGNAEETLLLGDKTKEVLDDMMSLIGKFRTIINQFALTESSASASTPLTPLLAGFQKLNADMNATTIDIQSINNKLESIKSSKIFTE